MFTLCWVLVKETNDGRRWIQKIYQGYFVSWHWHWCNWQWILCQCYWVVQKMSIPTWSPIFILLVLMVLYWCIRACYEYFHNLKWYFNQLPLSSLAKCIDCYLGQKSNDHNNPEITNYNGWVDCLGN